MSEANSYAHCRACGKSITSEIMARVDGFCGSNPVKNREACFYRLQDWASERGRVVLDNEGNYILNTPEAQVAIDEWLATR